jgi:quercetin dioxygenase-like cupin family protein
MSELQKSFRSKTAKLEETLKSLTDIEGIVAGTEDNPIVTDSKEIPIEHFFMDGVYVRQMTMYKGTVVVGAIHKHLHMCFLLKGHLSVASRQGVKEYIAPCFIIAEPGEQRVLYALEDSLWFNTHKNPSNTNDVKQLEKEIVAASYKEYEQYTKK